MAESTGATRRDFLKTSAALSTAIGAPTIIPSRVLGRDGQPGANDQIIIGLIGTGGRCNQLIDQVPAPGKIVAASDCFLYLVTETQRKKKTNWKLYQDYRKMFDAEKLDAVIIATPDHARTLPSMRAVIHGLDVYAEKPLTAYIQEGRQLVDAVRKHKRVFQVGSQQRSMEVNRFCCEFVRDGKLGPLKLVSAVNYPGPKRYTGLPEQPIPQTDDWNTWLGPTELRPFNKDLQFSWMQWRDYSGGEMTNWGAHGVDQIQWALGKDDTGPTELWPDGPKGIVAMRYADGTQVRFERDGGPMGGAVFIGADCKMEINRNKFTTNPPDFLKDAPSPAVADKWEGDGWIAKPHIENWLDCIKSRERPNADVEIGHRSISVCHLVNITRELNRKLTWDPVAERFINDDEANKLVTRPRRAGFELPEA